MCCNLLLVPVTCCVLKVFSYWSSFRVEEKKQLATKMPDTPGEVAQPSIVVNPSCSGCMEEFTPGSDWKHYVE